MMRLFITLVLASIFNFCAAQIPIVVSASANSRPASAISLDYTSNLYDEWTANRGFILKAGATDIQSWTGRVNSTVLTPDLAFGRPVNGELDVADNEGMQLPSTSDVSGDVSIAFLIKASSRKNAEQRLFHVVNTPQLILKLEISAANGNIGMLYASNNYDFGVQFPYDNQYHVVVFKILSGTSAALYMDGAKAGSTVTFASSTAINWTSGNTRRFFRTGSTGVVPFVGSCKKIRIYKEALTDGSIAIIGNHSNGFFNDIIDNTLIWRVGIFGQSQAWGTGIWSELPPELQGLIPNTYIWDFDFRRWIPFNAAALPGNLGIGPIVKLAYLFHQAHPNDLILINDYAVGGTSLSVDWNPDGSGPIYNNFMTYFNESTAVLDIEMRNNRIMAGAAWLQGETDTQDLTMANAYQGNEVILLSSFRAATGWTKITSANLHHGLPGPTYPWDDNVRAAKVFNAGNDPNLCLLNTDDTSRFPVDGGHVHYTTAGFVNLGTDLFPCLN